MGKILIGSRYFFSEFPDFESKDIDELEIVETTKFSNIRQITGQGSCYFQLKKQESKEGYIKYALASSLGMVVGKFLVPEFCQEIGFEIQDLPRLEPLIKKLDPQHEYEKIIYDSYIKNQAFRLTNEQREAAYESYKASRRRVN